MDLKIATYKDMKAISSNDNGETFVRVDFFDSSIMFGYGRYTCSSGDMKKYFDGKIIVRRTVAEKLATANQKLKSFNPSLTLFIAYGYRTLEIQEESFNKKYMQCDFAGSEDEKLEFIHTMTAVPDVAGHPTGGAVDLTIYDQEKKEFLDMGSLISDFSTPKYNTYAEDLTESQKANRELLHQIMIASKFCHYFGEWWHFCYGDKEWAFFYDEKMAIYEQKKSSEIVWISR